jgi:ComF family protein
MNFLKGAFQLLYPHTCTGCGSDLVFSNQLLCLRCIAKLPHTSFALFTGNPVEKIFNGRLQINAAHSEFFFSKNTLIQRLIHQLKYRNNRSIGIYLGELTGETLLKSNRFSGIDCLIPLPLYPEKEFRRGYNQAEVLCNGISNVTMIPVMKNNVVRNKATETQTRKHRSERWENVSGSFQVREPEKLLNKNVLLIDDVLTTGATLEACGSVISPLAASLSIAVVAHASK